MKKTNVLCIDDQREVLAVIKKDLQFLEPIIEITDCESAAEAEEVLNEMQSDNESVALIICDHIMPGENGIDFLVRINNDGRFVKTKKLLLTGLATHQDTIEAINEAEIDYYIEKPWDSAQFQSAVKKLLTKYLLESGADYRAYKDYLDEAIIAKLQR